MKLKDLSPFFFFLAQKISIAKQKQLVLFNRNFLEIDWVNQCRGFLTDALLFMIIPMSKSVERGNNAAGLPEIRENHTASLGKNLNSLNASCIRLNSLCAQKYKLHFLFFN